MGRNFFRPAHRDAAEPAIIDALRAVGASVHPVSGKDIPDLLVGHKGRTFLLEVKSRLSNTKKDGYTRQTTTKVSEGQQEFMDSWRGGPCKVVHTPEEALYAIGAPVEGVLQPLPVPERCACTHYANAHHATTGHCMVRNCECLGVLVETVLRDERRTGNVTPTHMPKKRK